MKKLEKEEMMKINGGAITASFLTAFARSLSTIMNVGQTLGSSIRRLFAGSYCAV